MSTGGVTEPRRIPMETTTFAISRHIQDRQFLLRPDALVTALVIHMLAACAPLFGIQIHAACVMSTHYHLVISASEQRISDFFELLDANLARAGAFSGPSPPRPSPPSGAPRAGRPSPLEP